MKNFDKDEQRGREGAFFLILAIIILMLTSCCNEPIEEPDDFFSNPDNECLYLGVLLNGDGTWTGTLYEFKSSQLYISGETYFFDIYEGENCTWYEGKSYGCWCENFEFSYSAWKTIP